MFTQKISMDCTKEQYEKFLKDELLKMGYKEWSFSYWEDVNFCYMCNNYNGYAEYLGNIHKIALWNLKRLYIGSFNAPLFLALAAMTDKAEGNYGEYWTCISENEYFTEGNIYKCVDFYSDRSPVFYDVKGDRNGALINYLFKYFRKATKDEIMAKFGKTETDTNYDAAKEFVEYFSDKANTLKGVAISDNIHQSDKKAKEQENAIKLLRENGYKILKPITWEEV